MRGSKQSALVVAAAVMLLGAAEIVPSTFRASDPGVRGGPAGAGQAIGGLNGNETSFFVAGRDDFGEAEGIGEGLGPRFNLDSCGGCHSQPDIGGTSPAVNPQVAVATDFGARNTLPSFVTPDGPVREARFIAKPDGSRDGGVHALFVISGRSDSTGSAANCRIAQENFDAQASRGNVIFRIPTPVFGLGLVEQITERAILANQAADTAARSAARISGRPNRNGNDGTISRFGCKAQNQSLLLFSGEA